MNGTRFKHGIFPALGSRTIAIKSTEQNELPKFLLMENVTMLVSKKFIHSFNEWLEFLETLGYKNYWEKLNAKDYGIPQTRNRVFLISILNPQKDYEFPKPFPLETKLIDYLEEDVHEKYFISEAFLLYATDPTDRNGFIRENALNRTIQAKASMPLPSQPEKDQHQPIISSSFQRQRLRDIRKLTWETAFILTGHIKKGDAFKKEKYKQLKEQ